MKELVIIIGCCLTGFLLAPLLKTVLAHGTEKSLLSYLEHKQKTEHREHNAKILAMLQRLKSSNHEVHEEPRR